MTSQPQVHQRGVARIDDPAATPGYVSGHRVRRLIGSDDHAFSDPFLLMARTGCLLAPGPSIHTAA